MAWRETDLSVFDQATLADRAWGRVRRAAGATRDAGHLATTIIAWRIADGARTLKTRAEAAYLSGKRLIRLPDLGRSGGSCIVIINLTMNRDPRIDSPIVRRSDFIA